MTVYSRAEWGALPRKRAYVAMGPVSRIFVHHSVTAPAPAAQIVRDIQRGHLTSTTDDYSDIAYHWLCSLDGDRYEGRGWGVRGGATSGAENHRSYAICAIGNYHPPELLPPPVTPSPALLDAVAATIAEGVHAGHILPDWELFAHRDAFATACPGDSLATRLPDIAARTRQLLDGATTGPGPVPIPLEDRVALLERQQIDTAASLGRHRAVLAAQREMIKAQRLALQGLRERVRRHHPTRGGDGDGET